MKLMSSVRAAIVAFVVALSLTCSPAFSAAVDYFLKIEGIPGESSRGTAGEIDVLSWSWGESNAGSSRRSKPVFEDIVITKELDKSSPKLMEACATGKHIPVVILRGKSSDHLDQNYLEYKLEDCLISSYSVGGSSGDNPGVENITIHCSSMTFSILSSTGEAVEGSWSSGKGK